MRTFRDFYMSGAPRERITGVLNVVFEEILGRFYAVSQVNYFIFILVFYHAFF
jgi:hypothetical protein